MWIFYICAAGVALLASLFIKQKALTDKHYTLHERFSAEEGEIWNSCGWTGLVTTKYVVDTWKEATGVGIENVSGHNKEETKNVN